MFLGDTFGFIAVGALAACLQWLVMCGMHAALPIFQDTILAMAAAIIVAIVVAAIVTFILTPTEAE